MDKKRTEFFELVDELNRRLDEMDDFFIDGVCKDLTKFREDGVVGRVKPGREKDLVDFSKKTMELMNKISMLTGRHDLVRKISQ